MKLKSLKWLALVACLLWVGAHQINTSNAQCTDAAGAPIPCPNNDPAIDPDTDGDAVPDSRDVCPTQIGNAAGNGCPDPASPVPAEPTPEAAEPNPLFPPTGGACNLVTAALLEVNVRANPSLDSEIVGALNPAAVYPVITAYTVDGQVWYLIAEGWVSGNVVQLGGDCTSAGTLLPIPDGLGLNLAAPVVDTNVDYVVGDGSVFPILGPDEAGSCFFHRDYGILVCTDPVVPPTGEPTPDFVPPSLDDQTLGVCLQHPEYGYITCKHIVEEGEGRFGLMNLNCIVGTSQCIGSILSFPSDPECPALLLPAVQKVRDAAARMSTRSVNPINIDALTSAVLPPDPCALMSYGLLLPANQVFADDLAMGDPTMPQTREHILLARQVGGPAAADGVGCNVDNGFLACLSIADSGYGDPTGYTCGKSPADPDLNRCECTGLWDCVDMITNVCVPDGVGVCVGDSCRCYF